MFSTTLNVSGYQFKKIVREIILILELCKIKISLLAAFSTATGFLLATEDLSIQMLLPVTGIFLVACGASILNHIQDKNIDALMDRTKSRPIPKKEISVPAAAIFSVLFLASGFFVLNLLDNWILPGLGILAVFWYNVIYSLLRRKTEWAILVGSLIGAIPPLTGWIAGGRSIFEPQIYGLACFFLIWQIPHFLLIQIRYGKEYETAGFPSVTNLFESEQLRRIVVIWLLATALSSVLIPFYCGKHTTLLNLSMFTASLWLLMNTVDLSQERMKYFVSTSSMRTLTMHAVVVLTLVSFDNILH